MVRTFKYCVRVIHMHSCGHMERVGIKHNCSEDTAQPFKRFRPLTPDVKPKPITTNCVHDNSSDCSDCVHDAYSELIHGDTITTFRTVTRSEVNSSGVGDRMDIDGPNKPTGFLAGILKEIGGGSSAKSFENPRKSSNADTTAVEKVSAKRKIGGITDEKANVEPLSLRANIGNRVIKKPTRRMPSPIKTDDANFIYQFESGGMEIPWPSSNSNGRSTPMTSRVWPKYRKPPMSPYQLVSRHLRPNNSPSSPSPQMATLPTGERVDLTTLYSPNTLHRFRPHLQQGETVLPWCGNNAFTECLAKYPTLCGECKKREEAEKEREAAAAKREADAAREADMHRATVAMAVEQAVEGRRKAEQERQRPKGQSWGKPFSLPFR